MDNIENLKELITPIVTKLNYMVYHIEYVKEDGEFYLRVYIEKENYNIAHSDCEKVSRAISEILDEKDPIEENYYLEVSSPGVFRVLFTDKHMMEAKGEKVLAKLKSLVEGKRKLIGILKDIGDNTITIEEDNKEYIIDKGNLKQVTLEVDI